jgi:SpoVK/Ycf46/Vps4 family AAA+-type ATPase
MGNPGTGKTTVARLLAKIYHAVGVLSKGQLVEVDRSGLVAGFVGQTALKTQEAVDKALGGVLFIDEAYALANQDNANDFGREAIEVLLKGMEDHRDDLIVIVAGYTDLMGDFIHANPGLESRFNKYFYFEDYDGGQLAEIFRSVCKKNGYALDEETDKAAAEAFQVMYERRDENFGNARDVRNVFEAAVARQANRVAAMEAPQKEDLMALTVVDLDLEDDDKKENSEKAEG